MSHQMLNARQQHWKLAKCVMEPACSFVKRKEAVINKFYILPKDFIFMLFTNTIAR